MLIVYHISIYNTYLYNRNKCVLDWPQLPPLPNHDEADENDDSEPDDSMEDSRPT